MFYRERGEGPLLLVLPGNTASSACHEGELQHFSDRYHVVSLDFFGTGKSERAAVWADAWWEQGAYQAQVLVDQLGFGECTVMGASGGAIVALLMAILFPQTVRSVIADSCVMRFTEEMSRQSLLWDRAQRTAGQVAFWEKAHGSDWEQVVEADTVMILRFANRGGDWFGGRLNEIQCPVLLTASKQDPLLPQVTQQVCGMAEQIAGARVYLNNEGGHPLMWSRPEVFRAISDTFLEDVEGWG